MSKIKPVQIVFTEREIHMIGEDVAVCWNTKEKKLAIEKDGVIYRATENVRTSEPYIDFVWLIEDQGRWYENDDNIGDGGIFIEQAEQLADDLTKAIQYLEEQKG